MSDDDYEFHIRISRDEVSCYFGPGFTNAQPDSVRFDSAEHLPTIKVLEEWLRRWEWIARKPDAERLLVRGTFRALGNHLWNMALANVPGQKLLDKIDEVQSSSENLRPTVRVRLTFSDDAGDLEALPWEFVRPPGDDSFYLAAETNLTLGRYVDGPGFRDAHFESPDDKLRVLFIMCLPDEKNKKYGDTYDAERGALEKLIDDLSAMGQTRLQLKVCPRWDRGQVRNKLAEFQAGSEPGPVDVVHLAAMFRREDRTDEYQLFMPDARGDWDWREADAVVRMLTGDRNNRPKMVILHLCDWHETDWSNSPEHFEQLAPAFIARGVHAVLAMQYPIRVIEGSEFVTTLYGQLARGANIGEAVQFTRTYLVDREDRSFERQFGTPVLYMQSKMDGSLVKSVAALDDDEPATNDRRPSPLTHATFSTQGLKPDLAEIIDATGAETQKLLPDWLKSQKWPPSGTEGDARVAARNAILQLLREENDKPDVEEALVDLLARIGTIETQDG